MAAQERGTAAVVLRRARRPRQRAPLPRPAPGGLAERHQRRRRRDRGEPREHQPRLHGDRPPELVGGDGLRPRRDGHAGGRVPQRAARVRGDDERPVPRRGRLGRARRQLLPGLGGRQWARVLPRRVLVRRGSRRSPRPPTAPRARSSRRRRPEGLARSLARRTGPHHASATRGHRYVRPESTSARQSPITNTCSGSYWARMPRMRAS